MKCHTEFLFASVVATFIATCVAMLVPITTYAASAEDTTASELDAASCQFTSTERPGVATGAILKFAREHRIPLVGLAVEEDLLAVVREKGRAGLTEEQRRRLPADSGAFADDPGDPATRLMDDVMADTVVRWMDASPDTVQLLVLAPASHVAHGRCLPRRSRERAGGKHRTLVLRTAAQMTDAAFAERYADFIWIAAE